MADQHIKSDIPMYLSNTLPESRRRELEAHIVDCERCRHALDKSKAKQSRQRRQALKTAQPGSTNLFLNRISKQGDIGRKSSASVWLWIFIFLVIGVGAYWASHHQNGWRHMWTSAAPPLPRALPVDVSTEAVSNVSVPTPVAAPVVSSAAAVSKPIRIAEVSASSPAVTAPEAEAPEVPRFWSGTDSGVKDERQVTVKGRTAWKTLWLEMGRTDPVPRVNFNTTIVVGIFLGEKPSAGYTVQMKEPQDESESILMAYSVDNPPATSTVPPAVTHPYALRTIPRSPKSVRFLEESK